MGYAQTTPSSKASRNKSVRISAGYSPYIEPWSRAYPYALQVRLFGVLDNAYVRQCSEWSREHRRTPRPPVENPVNQPGKDLADFQCNACHLFGSPEAPGFFQLARDGKTGVGFLSEALESGHRMSPIKLAPD